MLDFLIIFLKTFIFINIPERLSALDLNEIKSYIIFYKIKNKNFFYDFCLDKRL